MVGLTNSGPCDINKIAHWLHSGFLIYPSVLEMALVSNSIQRQVHGSILRLPKKLPTWPLFARNVARSL